MFRKLKHTVMWSGLKRKLLPVLPGLGLLFHACSPDAPEPVTEDPVFSISYVLNGQTGQITAGLDGVYLFTRAEKDLDSVWQCSGSFADVGCLSANCPGSFRFTWRSTQPADNFDATWQTGIFPYYRLGANPDSQEYQVNLNFVPNNDQTPAMVWTLNGQYVFDGPELVHTTTDTTLVVHVEADYPQGYTIEEEHIFLMPENRFCLQGAMEVAIDPSGGSMLNFSATAEPPGNHTYFWSTGDTTDTIQALWVPDAEYTVTISDPGSTCASLVTVRGLPDSFDVIRSGLVQGDALLLQPFPKDGPVIEWIGPQEESWRSDWGDQPFPAFFFEVLEVSDYDRNENGLPTKRLRVRWRCRLYNMTGESIPFEGEGVIAVAWPG
ncbi:MAG: hypothetical protein EP344_03405 [Bacteroidetes bacterium]|nr:MAG: hypothetical protein EP344_03405 [Bacteroidota bacterium]